MSFIRAIGPGSMDLSKRYDGVFIYWLFISQRGTEHGTQKKVKGYNRIKHIILGVTTKQSITTLFFPLRLHFADMI